MINTILWDFDGTLLNTNDVILESWQHTYEHYYGHRMPVEHITKCFGEPLLVTMAREFPDVTRSIAAAANAAKREYLRDETVADMIAENRCFEYVGRKLGEQIHRHMLHGEDHGDIWAKARARIIEIASTSGTVNAFVIDNAD